MRARLLALAAIVMVGGACGSVPSPPSAGTVVSPTSSPLVSGPPAASESRISQPSPVPIGELCRIPYADISEASGGFIYLPDGRKQADPSSVVALPGNTPGAIGVNPGLAWIPTLNRWVPVPLNWISPSDSFYAYMTDNGIREVGISDGSVHDIVTGAGWILLGVSQDGVYAAKASTPGVYWIESGAAPQQVVDHGTWQIFHDGEVWGIDDAGYLVRDVVTLSNLELRWGKAASSAWVVGFDAGGDPILNSGGALSVHHADGSATELWPGTNGLSAAGYAFGGTLGIVFSVGGGLVGAPGHGVYLWRSGVGAQLITPEEVNLMGPCGPAAATA